MKREDFIIGAKGYIVAWFDSRFPYIAFVTIKRYGLFGYFVAEEKDGTIHIIRDSQDIFYTAKEACDWLADACEKAIEETVDAESEDA